MSEEGHGGIRGTRGGEIQWSFVKGMISDPFDELQVEVSQSRSSGSSLVDLLWWSPMWQCQLTASLWVVEANMPMVACELNSTAVRDNSRCVALLFQCYMLCSALVCVTTNWSRCSHALHPLLRAASPVPTSLSSASRAVLAAGCIEH